MFVCILASFLRNVSTCTDRSRARPAAPSRQHLQHPLKLWEPHDGLFDVNDNIVLQFNFVCFNFFVRCFFDTCKKTAHHCSQSSVKVTWSSRIWINMRINPFASNFFHSCVNDTGLIWKPQVHTGITAIFSKIRPLWWLINQGPWLWHDKWPTNFGTLDRLKAKPWLQVGLARSLLSNLC